MANPQRGALLKPNQQTSKPKPISRTRNTSRYEILKDKIRTWWQDRIIIGQSLVEIRDAKLYKDEYGTFEEFCNAEYGFTPRHAYRLIEFAEIKPELDEILRPIGHKIANESQARALAAVPEEQRAEVVETAAAGNGKLTAKTITEAAETVTGRAAPPTSSPPIKAAAPRDRIGCPIPADVLPDWREAEALDDLVKQVHRMKLRVEHAIEERELAFREITNSTVADLQNAWSELQGVIPYVVCPTCEGHTRETCTLCRQRGFLSRFAYEHYVPEKTRQFREKLHAGSQAIPE